MATWREIGIENYRLNVSGTGLRHSANDRWEGVVQPDKEDAYSYDH